MHPFKPNLNLNLNISELHHPKCASNTTNNFDGFVSSLLTADHTCRRSEDEIWEYMKNLSSCRMPLAFIVNFTLFPSSREGSSRRDLFNLVLEPFCVFEKIRMLKNTEPFATLNLKNLYKRSQLKS